MFWCINQYYTVLPLSFVIWISSLHWTFGPRSESKSELHSYTPAPSLAGAQHLHNHNLVPDTHQYLTKNLESGLPSTLRVYLISSIISRDQAMNSRNLLLGDDRSTSYLNFSFTSSLRTLCRIKWTKLPVRKKHELCWIDSDDDWPFVWWLPIHMGNHRLILWVPHKSLSKKHTSCHGIVSTVYLFINYSVYSSALLPLVEFHHGSITVCNV